jgi:long-subunit acyl-CoA synthetase (AMP-forming)
VEILLQGASASESTIIESISYAQLHSQSNRLAHFFTTAGVRKGDLTAISLVRSIDTLISVLALAKIGAGLLSLAYDSSPQLTNSILATANPRFCIVNNRSVTDWTLPELTSQIRIPDSLSELDDFPASYTNDDGFHIICAENPETNNEPINPNPNLHSYSSHNIQSHIKALADSYPVPVSTGSKLLHTSPLASSSE